MTTKALAFSATLLVAAPLASQAQTAPTASAAPPPQLSPTEQTIQEIKNPVSWLTWGGDLRIRNEYFNNGLSLTTDHAVSPLFAPVHEQDYFRFRGRLWTTITPTEGLSLNVRLSAEPRDFMKPSTFDTFFNEEGMQWRYGILDTLNLEWRKPLDLPVTVKVGRQDLFLGDGWLVGDGTPNDGSFTTFVDAARVTLDLQDQHTTIDAIGLVQYARPDAIVPTIGPSTSQGGHPEPLSLTDQNEKGAILWVANKSVPAANLDAYFIYKHDDRVNDDPSLLFGDDADIFTFGGRLSGTLEEHWQYSAEGAYQFGEKKDQFLNVGGANPLLAASAQSTGFRNISAFGVNSKLSYLLKDDLNTRVDLSYEFLSGDDPKTGTDEMFDVLWGRWPRWSEVYNIYSYVQETRIGQTANLHRIGPTFSLSPTKKMDLSASYYVLLADQEVPTRSAFLSGAFGGHPFSDNGIFRGHYLQAILKYKFSKHVSGHLWGELVFPGDYYVSNDMISFLRAELMFTF